MINFTKIGHGSYAIHHENGVFCGDLVAGDDGYYCWWPPYPSSGGCWPEEFLTLVTAKLQELNSPMDEELEDFFKGRIE